MGALCVILHCVLGPREHPTAVQLQMPVPLTSSAARLNKEPLSRVGRGQARVSLHAFRQSRGLPQAVVPSLQAAP